MNFYWLSFADYHKPKEEQFLGATVIEARDPIEAIHLAWKKKLNPGGDVSYCVIRRELAPKFIQYRDRLVGKKELLQDGRFGVFNRNGMN